jgi:type IV pilus assembly protein PilE
MKQWKGFTLIELMIALLIVGILAAIGYPGYREFVKRGNRAAAQSVAMDISSVQQQYFLANRAYGSATDLGYSLPPEVAQHYTLTVQTGQTLTPACAVAASAIPSFVVTLTATGGQVSDGNLLLSNDGTKCPAGKWK